MALITDYASLKTEIATLLIRTDLAADMPVCVQLCESQMRRRLQAAGILGSVKRITDALTIGVDELALPADYGGDITIEIFDTNRDPARWMPLDAIDPVAYVELIAHRDRQSAIPKTYCLLDGKFAFSPIPDAAYEVRETYYGTLPALSDAAPTNWILLSYPDAYLYGSALQAAPRLIEDDRAPLWGQFFTTAISDIIASEKAKIGSRTTPLYRANLPLPRRRGFNIYTGQ